MAPLGAQRHQLYSRMIVCELVSRTASWTWLDLPHEGEGSSVVATTRGGRRRPPHSRWNTAPTAPHCESRFFERSTADRRPQRPSEMYPTKSQSAKLWGTSHSDCPPRSSDVSLGPRRGIFRATTTAGSPSCERFLDGVKSTRQRPVSDVPHEIPIGLIVGYICEAAIDGRPASRHPTVSSALCRRPRG